MVDRDRHALVVFLLAQALFLAVIMGYQQVSSEEAMKWTIFVARYITYLIAIRGFQEAFFLLRSRGANWQTLCREHKNSLMMLTASTAVLLVTEKEKYVSVEEFLCLLAASLISQYFLKERKSPTINYGVGMACSFFEGYLKLIIPSDGTKSGVGFEDKIREYEDSQGVVFPVRKLLLVITKSLFCPPDMNHYNNKNNPNLAYIEAMAPLSDVERDVAGVKNRPYRNSAYKIYRGAKLPVCVAVEFATPLHTLYKVLHNRDLYDELCDVDQEELVRDFCAQLQQTIERSPDTRGRCELIHFDDRAQNANLADVLLEKIKELEPTFEEILERHDSEMAERRLLIEVQADGDPPQAIAPHAEVQEGAHPLPPLVRNGPLPLPLVNAASPAA